MNQEVPQVIVQNGFDFRWDIKKVWALDIPESQIDLFELEWILDLPFWSDGNGWYNLTAREVIDNPDNYPEHLARLEKCDTSYPIDVMKNLKDRWLILDGLHRMVKLVADGKTTFRVRKIPRELIPEILK